MRNSADEAGVCRDKYKEMKTQQLKLNLHCEQQILELTLQKTESMPRRTNLNNGREKKKASKDEKNYGGQTSKLSSSNRCFLKKNTEQFSQSKV